MKGRGIYRQYKGGKGVYIYRQYKGGKGVYIDNIKDQKPTP